MELENPVLRHLPTVDLGGGLEEGPQVLVGHHTFLLEVGGSFDGFFELLCEEIL